MPTGGKSGTPPTHLTLRFLRTVGCLGGEKDRARADIVADGLERENTAGVLHTARATHEACGNVTVLSILGRERANPARHRGRLGIGINARSRFLVGPVLRQNLSEPLFGTFDCIPDPLD